MANLSYETKSDGNNPRGFYQRKGTVSSSGFGVKPYSLYVARGVGFDAPNQTHAHYNGRHGAQMDDAYNQAYSEMYERLGHKIDLSEYIAESSETLGMVADRALRLGRSFRALRRGKVATAARHLFGSSKTKVRTRPSGPSGVRRTIRNEPKPLTHKDASSIWLEWAYGWSPMLSDIYHAVTTDNLMQVPPTVVKGRGKSSLTEEGDSTGWRSGGWRTSSTWNYFHEVGVTVSVENPNRFLAEQFGLNNPANTVWNMVPFSFVLDWFVPVGLVLQSQTAFAGLKLHDGWSTWKCESNGAGQYYTYKRHLGEHVPSGKPFSGTAFKMERRVLSKPPTARLTHVPIKDVFSWRRAANAVALLISTLSK